MFVAEAELVFPQSVAGISLSQHWARLYNRQSFNSLPITKDSQGSQSPVLTDCTAYSSREKKQDCKFLVSVASSYHKLLNPVPHYWWTNNFLLPVLVLPSFSFPWMPFLFPCGQPAARGVGSALQWWHDTVFKMVAASWCLGPESGTKPIIAMTRCLVTVAKSCNKPGPPSVASEHGWLGGSTCYDRQLLTFRQGSLCPGLISACSFCAYCLCASAFHM